jgi:Zn-dependent alcohol dehydrogenase
MVEMQRGGQLPFERLCTTYKYTELEQAISDMHAGTVRMMHADIEDSDILKPL